MIYFGTLSHLVTIYCTELYAMSTRSDPNVFFDIDTYDRNYLLKLVDAVLIGRAELPISEVRGMARSRVAASLSESLDVARRR